MTPSVPPNEQEDRRKKVAAVESVQSDDLLLAERGAFTRGSRDASTVDKIAVAIDM